MRYKRLAILLMIGLLLAGSLSSCMGTDLDNLFQNEIEDTLLTTASDNDLEDGISTNEADDKNKTGSTDHTVEPLEISTEEEASATTEEPVIRKLTVTATGDCSLGALQTHEYARSFHSYYDQYGEGYFMENFKDIFEADDFTLVNLECTLTNLSYDPESNPEKEFYIVGRPDYNNFQPICLEGEEKAALIDRVNIYSAPYSPVHFDSDGVMLIDEDEK